jgi:hypothetical protein
MLAFLRNLPEDYFVYRELQVTEPYEKRMRGYEKKQPDFVVVSPAVGVMAIEVKHWNLTRNIYHWRNQYKILKTERSTGFVQEIDNPTAQAKAYEYALMELVAGLGVFVSSIVAFPTVSRSDFVSRIENLSVLQIPQGRFYLDLNRTLFREDLDRDFAQPEVVLVGIANSHPKFQAASPSQAERANMRLLPSSFRIGDYTERQQNQRRLKLITQEQQRWIDGLEEHQNYLLDVAGSGKTNVLISKAMRLVEAAGEGALPRILITTYSQNLETNIRRIFRAKIADSTIRTRYQDAVTIQSVPAVMEQMIITVLGLDSIDRYRTLGESREAYEERLRDDVEAILRSEPDRFRRFDHVFVDEIQDFDDLYLHITDHLGKAKSFFFVGDIGQKIYERSHSLEGLGFVRGRVELKKSYKMYRTPRYIAELATRFILHDPLSRREFADQGYTEDFKYPNKLRNTAEIVRSEDPQQETAVRVRDLLDAGYAEADVLVITSVARLAELETALGAAGIEYVLGEPEQGTAVSLAPFMDVKGLEKEVVLITGIEDLYERSKPQAMFDDEDSRYRKELLSLRKVYVALTRPLEKLIVYYQDGGNRFLSDLVEINSDILSRLRVR